MAEKIKLSNDLKTFEIEFEGRNKSAEISFNPSDLDLAKRLSIVEKRIEKKLNNIGNKPKSNSKSKSEDYIDIIEEVDKTICSEIDYAFGNKISDKVFQFCSPLAIVNGKYYVTIFLEAISPVIEKYITEANEKLNEHIKEYL